MSNFTPTIKVIKEDATCSDLNYFVIRISTSQWLGNDKCLYKKRKVKPLVSLSNPELIDCFYEAIKYDGVGYTLDDFDIDKLEDGYYKVVICSNQGGYYGDDYDSWFEVEPYEF